MKNDKTKPPTIRQRKKAERFGIDIPEDATVSSVVRQFNEYMANPSYRLRQVRFLVYRIRNLKRTIRAKDRQIAKLKGEHLFPFKTDSIPCDACYGTGTKFLQNAGVSVECIICGGSGKVIFK